MVVIVHNIDFYDVMLFLTSGPKIQILNYKICEKFQHCQDKLGVIFRVGMQDIETVGLNSVNEVQEH